MHQQPRPKPIRKDAETMVTKHETRSSLHASKASDELAIRLADAHADALLQNRFPFSPGRVGKLLDSAGAGLISVYYWKCDWAGSEGRCGTLGEEREKDGVVRMRLNGLLVNTERRTWVISR